MKDKEEEKRRLINRKKMENEMSFKKKEMEEMERKIENEEEREI